MSGSASAAWVARRSATFHSMRCCRQWFGGRAVVSYHFAFLSIHNSMRGLLVHRDPSVNGPESGCEMAAGRFPNHHNSPRIDPQRGSIPAQLPDGQCAIFQTVGNRGALAFQPVLDTDACRPAEGEIAALRKPLIRVPGTPTPAMNEDNGGSPSRGFASPGPYYVKLQLLMEVVGQTASLVNTEFLDQAAGNGCILPQIFELERCGWLRRRFSNRWLPRPRLKPENCGQHRMNSGARQRRADQG